MYLSDLCTAKNTVFSGFVRFPQLYPPETKIPLGAKVIAPGRGAYPGDKPMAISQSDHGVHFFDHGVQNDHRVFIFSDHGVQMPFGEGSKVNTPSVDRRKFPNLP